MLLSDNNKRRQGYRKNSAIADQERRGWAQDIWVLAREQDSSQRWPLPPLRIVWEVRWPDSRIRDPDNIMASLKVAMDGLCDAAVIPGDDHRYVRELTIRSLMGYKVGWGTTLTIQGLSV
jgi:Holliday junction resolvase RusA-like endonuclease